MFCKFYFSENCKKCWAKCELWIKQTSVIIAGIDNKISSAILSLVCGSYENLAFQFNLTCTYMYMHTLVVVLDKHTSRMEMLKFKSFAIIQDTCIMAADRLVEVLYVAERNLRDTVIRHCVLLCKYMYSM